MSVNSTSGVISLISELDADVMTFSLFRVTCTAGKKDFMMEGHISLMDINDNAPTTNKGESMKRIIEHVKPVSIFIFLQMVIYKVEKLLFIFRNFTTTELSVKFFKDYVASPLWEVE